MDLRGQRESQNVEDRRGTSFGRGGGFGLGRGPVFGGGIGRGAGRGGIGGIILVLLFLGFAEMTGLLDDLSPAPTATSPATSPATRAGPPQEEELRGFVSRVLASTEESWHEIFRAEGATYQEPKLVLFSGAIDSGCGFAESAVGPFYCPADRRVYLDLTFLAELRTRFGAPGDFAQAYVIAHEVGHHVQNLMGLTERVAAQRGRVSQEAANANSVRLELQADCFAGVWAHRANAKRKVLEEGDVEEGLGAAAAVGDDRLQKQARGHVVPESFTHGSSDQRKRWFQRGLTSGELSSCNTFAAQQP